PARALIDLPLAAAARARPREGEEAVTHADLAAPLARIAGGLVRARLAAASCARLATHQPRNLDLRLQSRRRIFEGDLQLVLEVLAARRARAAAPTAARGGEEVLEDVLDERAQAALGPAHLCRAPCSADPLPPCTT